MTTNRTFLKRAALVLLAASATFSFVLSAEGSARALTRVFRTVSASACVARTQVTQHLTLPGWDCGIQAGSEPNGSAVSGQLSSVYFDYTILNSNANLQVCIGKASSSGSTYGDCITPAKPGSYPSTREQPLTPTNVKQDPSVWDYLYVNFNVSGARVYSNYTPMDIIPIGVGMDSYY
jgi:hypothetical protein